MAFIEQLTSLLNKSANTENASYMTDYMRGMFSYYGVKTTPRRTILKQAYQDNKIEVANNVRALTTQLYSLKQREYHLCATEIFEKHLRKKYIENDIELIEMLITTNSWWDTVDFISKQILGAYFLMYPNQVSSVISKFSNTKDIWLNRSTIIFQLGYKGNTNENLLFKQCIIHKDSEEFFIQKAIGWALREYGKTNPKSVLNFVNSTHLKPLSQKEALRNII